MNFRMNWELFEKTLNESLIGEIESIQNGINNSGNIEIQEATKEILKYINQFTKTYEGNIDILNEYLKELRQDKLAEMQSLRMIEKVQSESDENIS